ncbi:TetR/AcrR family transcriptional regulator C-terminal ligand-binding domain-containing protein [Microbacterium sp. YMB-B2]|uniref:TetR/AcrR family transcriptional regulator C-terminal ligand-binding domain-containing protein n=2 Tax=Microbacterium tenebrionis TaxID=2830665 RepID=A0A9X1LMP7_9MICO|nr:TetR/AcrR family transcriptional regulator C-terminal ligand-binding domain-containing protein [Microbacterium tenebrionis]
MRAALAADGYAAVTIEGLAAEAEVSKQTIYRWWPSKAEILGEALLEGALPMPSLPVTDDLAADLRAWFSAMSVQAGHGTSVEVARALIAVTATDAELGAALNAKLAGPIIEQIVARLTTAQAAGEVRADVDAAAVADQFIAMSSYAALLGRPLDEKRVDAVVDGLMRGIRMR